MPPSWTHSQPSNYLATGRGSLFSSRSTSPSKGESARASFAFFKSRLTARQRSASHEAMNSVAALSARNDRSEAYLAMRFWSPDSNAWCRSAMTLSRSAFIVIRSDEPAPSPFAGPLSLIPPGHSSAFYSWLLNNGRRFLSRNFSSSLATTCGQRRPKEALLCGLNRTVRSAPPLHRRLLWQGRDKQYG